MENGPAGLDKKMKVIFGVYPWAFDCPGGGEQQLLAYKKHLDNSNYQVRCFNQWEKIDAENKIFHFFSVMPGSIQLCGYMKGKGLKLVISPNLWVTPETKYKYPHQDIYELLHIADLIIVNSYAEKEQLTVTYGLQNKKVRVVYNGVEEEFRDSIDGSLFRKWAGIKDIKYILNVANIEPRKNQQMLLRAMKEYPELKLINIGQCRDEEYYQECKREGGDQFLTFGRLEYASEILRSAMAGCELFAMPSTLETPSIAALEAAYMGKKILITEVGSTREYFGEEAIYVNPMSLESITNGLRKVLLQETSESQIVQRNLLWSHTIKALSSFYTELLEENDNE